jgi:AcrR family transcriptional regulator
MSLATTPRSLKERQRQEREHLILQAAEELLLERGYHETSIDEIAARVGVAKGTVYLHFNSKEELVFALFERELQSLLASTETILSTPASPRARLQAIIEHVSGSLSSQRMRLLGGLAQNAELRGLLAAKKQGLMERLEEPTRRLYAVLDEGKAAGEFDPTMPTAVMLTMFTGVLTPFGHQRLIVQEHLSTDEVVKQVSRFFFRGIGAEV